MSANSNELYHYGVLGMKWGVRRYQNFDGSYTKAGLKRYNKSMSEYEAASDAHKAFKSAYKQAKRTGEAAEVKNHETGEYSVIGKETVKSLKSLKKDAKKQVVKDYKHLKQDKLGDQGKKLYANGHRITGASAATKALATIGSAAASVALYNEKTNSLGSEAVTKSLRAIGYASSAAAVVKGGYDFNNARKLRAYYGHTSNY